MLTDVAGHSLCHCPLIPSLCSSYPLCSQVLLGHPPSYTADVAAPVSAVSLPPAVLSPPLPDTLLPTVPELLPKLPSSLAPTVVAASQTSTLLLPTNPPLPTGPAVAGPCPAVQLMVEVAQEVCAFLFPAPATWGLSPRGEGSLPEAQCSLEQILQAGSASPTLHWPTLGGQAQISEMGFPQRAVRRLPRAFENPVFPF